MASHALLAPSAAPIWEKCPGSVRMQAQYPKPPDSPSAVEGTAAHWVFAEMLYRRPVALDDITPQGIPVTQEMLEGAALFLDHIGQVSREHRHTSLNVERPVTIPSIHPEHCYGTPDVWAFNPELYILDIWDYKFGHGYVRVFEGAQFICYGSGILDELRRAGFFDHNITVHFHVVQPRNYSPEGPIRSWTVPPAGLRPHVNLLAAAAEEAVNPVAPCRVNELCKYCSANYACEALNRSALAAVDMAHHSAPFDLTADQLGAQLRLLNHAKRMLEARAAGLESEALNRMQAGQRVPFFQMVREVKREIWDVPAPEVIAIASMLGVELAKPVAAVTPAQARLAAKGNPAALEVLETLVTRAQGAAKLAPDDFSNSKQVMKK